jgi:hypothetical protein
MMLNKVVSGGQTGVDRGALDAARAWSIPTGGWIQAGRIAEDGRLADEYPLKETDETDPSVRTRRNVEDSDGTLLISHGALVGGSLETNSLGNSVALYCMWI